MNELQPQTVTHSIHAIIEVTSASILSSVLKISRGNPLPSPELSMSSQKPLVRMSWYIIQLNEGASTRFTFSMTSFIMRKQNKDRATRVSMHWVSYSDWVYKTSI